MSSRWAKGFGSSWTEYGSKLVKMGEAVRLAVQLKDAFKEHLSGSATKQIRLIVFLLLVTIRIILTVQTPAADPKTTSPDLNLILQFLETSRVAEPCTAVRALHSYGPLCRGAKPGVSYTQPLKELCLFTSSRRTSVR